MQIMPRTWRDLEQELGISASPYNAKVNILFGTHYMKKMVRVWKAPRTDAQRLELAQASYNAGAGNILKAQAKCGGTTWHQIAPCLRQVTGAHATETTNYVARIKRWYDSLLAS